MFDERCFTPKILLIPNKFPMNCQQIYKAIDPSSHCCHFCISQKWSECLFLAKTSSLECCIYSAAKIKYTLLTFLLVSLYFKCIFTWHQAQISPEDFEVPALCPLLRFQQYQASSPCPTHLKPWRSSSARAEQPRCQGLPPVASQLHAYL